MDVQGLSFASLNERIELLPEHPSLSPATSRRTKIAYVIGGSSALLAMIVLQWPFLGAKWSAVAGAALVALEAIGLGVALAPNRWRWPTFKDEMSDQADVLDFDRPHYESLLAWLSFYPLEQLQAMSAYARLRHDRMKDRMPLFTGSFEKLGVLPVIGAVVVQIRSFLHGAKYGWLDLVLVAALLIAFWMAWALVLMRFRLDQMAHLLTEACQRKTSRNTTVDAVTSVVDLKAAIGS